MILPHAILQVQFVICSRKIISFPLSPTFSNSCVNITDCSKNVLKNPCNIDALNVGAIILLILFHMGAEIIIKGYVRKTIINCIIILKRD